ncbi:MAG: type I-U CRISPR-associated protein Csx17 [Acidimicrobiales bacterium]
MTVIRLDGCATEPLLSYLSAFGVLSAVSEQLDPDAAGWWHQARFHVELTDADREGFVDFFADTYRPLPIISPWNSRGGFRLDRLQTSEKRVASIEESDLPRLEPYRRAIRAAREVWLEAEHLGLIGGGSVGARDKAEFVKLCRGRLPDEALGWLDTAVVILGDDEKYPDLLGGTGGNLGSGDLSSNAHDAAWWLCSESDVRDHVRHALFGEGAPKLRELLVGQFDPAGAGGVNMGPSSSIVNPVSFLLALEGASLFASGVARRLDGSKAAAVPFTVRVSDGVAPTAADRENVRSELWLPEWSRPMTSPEVRVMLAEGRAQWSGSQSTSTLDFARAAASLGVDRSVTAFTRYLIAERHGQANLAVPVGRFSTGERRSVELTAAIDPFLRSVERVSNPTQAVKGAANVARRRIFDVAQRDTTDNARGLLSALFTLERAVGRSQSARETVTRPVQGLRAVDWLDLLDDATPEFRVARAIASLRDRTWAPERGAQAREVSTMSVLCRPVERDGWRRATGASPSGVDVLVWSDHPIIVDLAARDVRAAIRDGWRVRSVRCAQHPIAHDGGAPEEGDVLPSPGLDVAFDGSVTCGLADVIAFGARELDDHLIREWLEALVMLDWTDAERGISAPATTADEIGVPLGPAFATTVPFFSRVTVRVGGEGAIDRSVRFRPTGSHVMAVARGDVMTATRLAVARLRQFGLGVPVGIEPAGTDTGPFDAALVPMSPRDTSRSMRSIDPPHPSTFSPRSEELS